MGKYKSTLQTHHLYLGVGGMLSVAALVIALTFGLSSAQQMCPTGQYWDMGANACVAAQCPAGYTGTPPNCAMAGGASQVTCSNGTLANSMDACPKCPDGSFMPMSGCTTASMPAGGCPSGQYWNGSACATSMTNTTEMQTSCTSAGGTWNSANTPPCTMPQTACPSGYTGTPPNCTAVASTCTSGQWWDPSTQACRATDAAASACTTPGYVMCPSRNNQCVTTTDCANATPVCAAGQTPSSATPCRASADTTTPATTTSPMMSQEEMQRACASAGGTWNSANTPPCAMPTMDTTTTTDTMATPIYSYKVQCPALNNREVNPEECAAATPYCAEGTYPSMENPCKARSTMTSTQTAEMMQCADPYDARGRSTMYLSKEFRKWDQETRQEIVKRMNSCEDWYAQFREDEARMTTTTTRRPMPMPTPTGEIDCQRDYRNPFCKSGNLDHEVKFKNVVKDTKDYIDDIRLGDDLAYEVRTLKFEAVVKDLNDPVECRQTIGPFPGPYTTGAGIISTAVPSFVRPAECDIIDAEREMMNISLEAGIACPVSGSIQSVIDQVQPDFDFIRSLNARSSAKQVKEGRARLQRAREALQQLIGSWDDAEETSKPGLMQGLNSCRDVGYLTRDAERMLEEFKYLSDTDEYKELASFAANPLAYLPSGVDIFAPWQPDMDVCFDENMILGGDGGIPGPKKSMRLGQKSYGRNAVLLDPVFEENFEEEFDENFDEEDMMEEPGISGGRCGFFEPPPGFGPKAECLPPATRYLGMQYGVLHDLAKALSEKGCESEDRMRGRFACEGFKQAPQELAKNGSKLPKTVRDIVNGFVSEGTQYCDAGDDASAEKVFRAMMQTVMPYMRGTGTRPILGGNTKKQVIDQMKERGAVGEQDKKRIAALEKEISLLSDQLVAMEVKFQELLVAKVSLEQQLGKVKNIMKNLNIQSEHIARLQENDAISQIGRRLADVNEKHMSLVSAILEVLPRGANACKQNLAEALDATFQGLSTEGNQTVDQMLDGLYSKVSSGALTAEEVVKACEGVKERFAALANSESEINAARQEGVIAFKDTPLNHWAGSFALIAVNNNLATATNDTVGVGNNEMYAQAVVRAVRLGAMADPEKMGKKLGEYLALDKEKRNAIVLEKDVPGLAEASWARPFVAVCQEFDVKECLTPPVKSLTDTITRAQMAGLLVHVLDAAGIARGSIANIATPTDSADHAYLEEIKVVKAWGVMGVCGSAGGSNFCPDQSMNVGMDLVAAVNTSNYINSVRALREAATNLEE